MDAGSAAVLLTFTVTVGLCLTVGLMVTGMFFTHTGWMPAAAAMVCFVAAIAVTLATGLSWLWCIPLAVGALLNALIFVACWFNTD